MFTITNTPEFTHEITVTVPVDGGHEHQSFKARFRVVDDEKEHDFTQVTAVKAYLREILIRIDDLADPSGNEVPWADAVREQLLALPHVRLALLRGYRAALVKERLGN